MSDSIEAPFDHHIAERYPSFPTLLAYVYPDDQHDEEYGGEAFMWNLTDRDLWVFQVWSDGEIVEHHWQPGELISGCSCDEDLAHVTINPDPEARAKVRTTIEMLWKPEDQEACRQCRTICALVDGWS